MRLSGILFIIMMTMGGVGYWYYTDTQRTIAVLTENNAKLEMAVATNEQAIQAMVADNAAKDAELQRVNSEFASIRRQNQQLAGKLAQIDMTAAAIANPEAIERAVNRGSVNAGRCFELLSGAELTEREKNAKNDIAFNKECPWLYDSYKSRGLLNDPTTNTSNE